MNVVKAFSFSFILSVAALFGLYTAALPIVNLFVQKKGRRFPFLSPVFNFSDTLYLNKTFTVIPTIKDFQFIYNIRTKKKREAKMTRTEEKYFRLVIGIVGTIITTALLNGGFLMLFTIATLLIVVELFTSIAKNENRR